MGVRHPVDELAGGGAAAERGLEVGHVASAFTDLAAGVVVRCLRVAMAGIESARATGLTCGNAARMAGSPRKWSACGWVMYT